VVIKEAGVDLRVIELPGDRLPEAVGILARSFYANPNFIDLFPDEEARVRALPHVQRACLRDALGVGRIYAASLGGQLVGVAAWLPPGGFPLSPQRQLRAAPDLARVLAAAPRLLEPVLARADEAGQPCYLETMTERNVAWYLRLGFEVRSAGISFAPGGPPNWTMLRRPRPR